MKPQVKDADTATLTCRRMLGTWPIMEGATTAVAAMGAVATGMVGVAMAEVTDVAGAG